MLKRPKEFNILCKNVAQCRLCNRRIESIHRHDYVSCTCGAIAIDGGLDYLRRTFQDFNNIVELSEHRWLTIQEAIDKRSTALLEIERMKKYGPSLSKYYEELVEDCNFYIANLQNMKPILE